MSTAAPVLAIHAALVGVGCTFAACGWHTGPPPSAASGGAVVHGSVLEPAARAIVEEALAVETQARGAGAVMARVDAATEGPAAVGALGVSAWTVRITAVVGRPNAPDCGGRISGERAWAATHPDGAGAARAVAYADLAREIARRSVAAVEASCR
jgi:hypothetical protein